MSDTYRSFLIVCVFLFTKKKDKYKGELRQFLKSGKPTFFVDHEISFGGKNRYDAVV